MSSRGLRQGNRLSSFLFLMVADALSAILKKAESEGLVKGFRVGEDRLMVS